MIISCVIAYNEERLLPGCLESLVGQVDEVVVVDGAFEHYPHEVARSTDATRAIAEAYGCRWVATPGGKPWVNQVAKRNAYLVGKEGDWYFVIDADERVQGKLPLLQTGHHYAFMVHTWQGTRAWTPRLFEHRGYTRYEGSHNALWYDARLVGLAGAMMWNPEWCQLLHLTHARTVEQQLKKRAYYRWRIPFETPYRRTHGI